MWNTADILYASIQCLQGSVAFAAQQAWIQNATVRDNILFGQTYNEEKYDKIVDAVALRPDFDILDNGDLTLIGEKVRLLLIELLIVVDKSNVYGRKIG